MHPGPQVARWVPPARRPSATLSTVGDPEPSLPLVVGRADARAAGLGDRRTSRMMADGRWTRLRRGQAATVADLEPEMRWRAEVLAVLAAHRRTLALAYASAARAWRLPVPLGGWGDLQFVAASGPTRRRAGVVVRVAPLDASDVTAIGRVSVTTAARTVADCARHLHGRDALAMADHALRVGLVTISELQTAIERQQGWPGAQRARRVLALAEGRRETPIESWSAWAFEELGVPRPRWQVTVLDADGVFVGRVDSLWAEKVAGEADGRAKYAATGDAPEHIIAAVHSERRREVLVRRTGLAVVRWSTGDLLVHRRAVALARHIGREVAVDRAVSARLLEL